MTACPFIRTRTPSSENVDSRYRSVNRGRIFPVQRAEKFAADGILEGGRALKSKFSVGSTPTVTGVPCKCVPDPSSRKYCPVNPWPLVWAKAHEQATNTDEHAMSL